MWIVRDAKKPIMKGMLVVIKGMLVLVVLIAITKGLFMEKSIVTMRISANYVQIYPVPRVAYTVCLYYKVFSY